MMSTLCVLCNRFAGVTNVLCDNCFQQCTDQRLDEIADRYELDQQIDASMERYRRIVDGLAGTLNIPVRELTGLTILHATSVPASPSPISKVVGIDPSIRATGVARGESPVTGLIKTKLRGPACFSYICSAIQDFTEAGIGTMAVIEGHAFAARRHAQALERAELVGAIKTSLWGNGAELLIVPPKTLKKFATGNGNASKEDVVKVVRGRGQVDLVDHDRADAYVLRCIGLYMLGRRHPLGDLPHSHTKAVEKLVFPIMRDRGGSS